MIGLLKQFSEDEKMKLPVRHKYFEEIKAGRKTIDFRDAHITFVDEETEETLRKEITHVDIIRRTPGLYPDVLKEEYVIRFFLEQNRERSGSST